MSKLKIGYMPTKRRFFSGEDAFKYKGIIRAAIGKIAPDVEFVDLEGLNDTGLLASVEDAGAAAKRFIAAGVDAVFTPHCNFGCEEAVAIAAKKVNVPVLLWGPRDESPLANGERLRDSQCGLFATSKVLQRFGVPFSYIINSRVDDPVFVEGFRRFVAAADVVRNFKNARIGQIATRPKDFYSVIVNEGELLERFGIQTVPMDMGKLAAEVRSQVKNPSEALRAEAEALSKKVDFSLMTADAPLKMAALRAALAKWKRDEGLNAAAFQCWDQLQLEIGICPCFVNSVLIEEGFPVACETDIHGALSMLMQQAASHFAEPVFLADLTIRHPDDDNAELLWHCGAFPSALADGPCKLNKHFVLPGNPDGVCNWKLKKGHITVNRFDGVRGKYSLFSGECDAVDGPFNQGTYVYVRMPDWSVWEEKFIYGPYIHHVSCVYGSLTPVMKEAVRFIDGLEFDPVCGGASCR